MATTYTELFQLPKHAITDPFDITLINDSMDIIEKALGKRSRVFNLLDNSDFLPGCVVNQRGTASTKTDGAYIADRWIVNISNSAATVSIGSGGITLEPTNSNYVSIYQKLEHYAELSGKVCTLGVCINGVWEATTFTMANENGGKLLPCGLRVYSTGNTYQVMIRNLAGAAPVTIQRVVLYEGTYTAATLPDYQPKGYAVELMGCQRYYHLYATMDARPVHGMDCSPPMRINAPTQGAITIDGTVYYYNAADL